MPRTKYNRETNEKKIQILNRITDLLSKNGKTRNDLIEYLQLPVGTYSNWSRGKGFQYMLYIDEIAKYFNVSVYYLIYGKDPFENLLNGEIRSDEVELLKKYNELDEEDREKAIRIISALK